MKRLLCHAERPSRVREVWLAWLVVYGVLWGFTLGAAFLVWVLPGAPAFARGVLGLSLDAAHNPSPSVGPVVAIAANNSLHSVWPLALGVLGAQRRRFTRALADMAVVANLLVPGLLVGGAVGGYGRTVLAFLSHVPLEWAGIAVGGAGWVVEREREVCRRERASAAFLTVAVLICAAFVEGYLVPNG